MNEIITKNEVVNILGLDYDFDNNTIEMYKNEASIFVISKTDYNYDLISQLKEQEQQQAKTLAKNIARRYLIESYFKTQNDSQRDMTTGLVSAVVDLQLLVEKAKKEKARNEQGY